MDGDCGGVLAECGENATPIKIFLSHYLWAEIIKTAKRFKSIMFLTGNTMEGIFIDVCQSGGSCFPCGVTPDTPVGRNATVYCTGGFIRGDEIRLTRVGGKLRFCELYVFGSEG